MKDNFGFKHKAGVLTAVSSLPSKYGIGGFGKECFNFIDFLCETGQQVWQVLPLNPTAYGDSPYQSPASMAGSPYYIDPVTLYKDGLLTKDEVKSFEHLTDKVDYGYLFENKFKMLSKAYARFEKTRLYVDYCRKNKFWLDDYALFMALKVKHNYMAWNVWEDEYKNYNTAKTLAKNFKDEIDFWKFVQYEFYIQWQKVLDYAHKNNIVILGDMPIYVAYDSVDVWSNTKQFLLDSNLNPTKVAGCPPDGFSPDGQLWGNPIYDWPAMESDGYKWWVNRVKQSLKMYDIIRIDHFRGFASYYAVPYGDTTARKGSWYDATGQSLFYKLQKSLPKLKVVAEDLGYITPDVKDLLNKTNFPGMKMLQFAFFDDDAEFLPRNYTSDNCVVYTGTHDSDATFYWVNNMYPDTKARFLKEVPIKRGQKPLDALIIFAHKSRANLSIIPLIDYMALGNDSRMNIPATDNGNWTFRLKPTYPTKRLKKHILSLMIEGGRL